MNLKHFEGHTPGPWNLHEHYVDKDPVVIMPEDGGRAWVSKGYPFGPGEKIVGEADLSTAEGGWPSVESPMEAAANARLCAAAPELLSYARELRDELARLRAENKRLKQRLEQAEEMAQNVRLNTRQGVLDKVTELGGPELGACLLAAIDIL